MKKKLLCAGLLSLSLLNFSPLYGQWKNDLWIGKQANNWIFVEDLRLNFNTSPPSVFLDSQTSANTEEGVGTISDQNGDLLFSISSDTLWNKNNQPMVNGTGLRNGFTAVQTGLIVPMPNSNDLYYVFQIEHKHIDPDKGATLSYSVVDMSLNGGLGEVIDKNITLASPIGDKLTAVHHADGERVWIIVHEGNYGGASDKFLAFLVSENGVDPPIASSIGATLIYSDAGQMKASPDGSKIAYAEGLGFFGIPLNVWSFDFDNLTGQVTNPVDLTNALIPSVLVYGLEFSPNSRFLYVTNPGIPNYLPAKLHQFDLDAGSPSDILSSHEILAETTVAPSFWAMQLGLDGKIYMANSNLSALSGPGSSFPGTISVINYPNNPGMAADFQHQAIPLQGQNCGPGLPGFIQSYFESGILHDGECAYEEISFSTIRIPGIESIVWDFGDGETGSGLSPTHIYNASGTYTVTAEIISNGALQTATTEITILEGAKANQPTPLAICDDGTGNPIFDLTLKNTDILNGQDPTIYDLNYFTSQSDAENNINPIVDPGSHQFYDGKTIYARVTNTNTSCYATTQFELVVNPNFNLPNDLALHSCSTFNLSLISNQLEETFSLSYYLSQTDAENELNNIKEVDDYLITTQKATIYVRAENEMGCIDVAPVLLMRGGDDCIIPQGISPNGDAHNEYFDLSHLDIKSLEIFNRFGRSVYKKESYTNQWFGQTTDGDELGTGTYFYVIKLNAVDAVFNTDVLTGWIYVNRQVN